MCRHFIIKCIWCRFLCLQGLNPYQNAVYLIWHGWLPFYSLLWDHFCVSWSKRKKSKQVGTGRDFWVTKFKEGIVTLVMYDCRFILLRLVNITLALLFWEFVLKKPTWNTNTQTIITKNTSIFSFMQKSDNWIYIFYLKTQYLWMCCLLVYFWTFTAFQHTLQHSLFHEITNKIVYLC